jgi:hypothetical protein
LSSEKTTLESSLLFFLGAGASVPAGVSDVRGLVKEYIEWLISNSKKDQANRIEKVTRLIADWQMENKFNRKVDIELLLEAIENAERIEEDIVGIFFENEKDMVSEFKGNSINSKELKMFIKEKCFVPDSRATYLEPLLEFIDDSGCLDVFSTNYDNSLEQLSDIRDIRCIDGFDSTGWNPQVFRERRGQLNIYKLHGSITWWRTEEGDYKSIPIKDDKGAIELASGKTAVPFILYPGKKLEYNDPFFDILYELRRLLRTIRCVIIAGYSFKDKHITRIFQYAAKRNRKFIMFLISPSAFEILESQLKYYDDEEFRKGYSTGFDPGGFTSPILSKLAENRVISLPYKFEKVLPILKSRYINNLRDAESLEIQLKTTPEGSTWNKMIEGYINCEHLEKVEEIINRIGWEKLAARDWRWLFGITLKALLNRLQSNEENSRNRWYSAFSGAAAGLHFDRFNFIPTLGFTASTPNHIELRIGDVGHGIFSNHLSEYLEGSIVPILEDKINLVDDEGVLESISTFLNKITRLKD